MLEAGGFVVGHQPLHVFEVLAASFAGRGDDLSAGLAAEPLVAGVGEDPQVDGVGEEVDDAGLAGLGDVRAAAGSVSPQNSRRPRVSVKTRAFMAFCLLLPETNRSRPGRPAAGWRTGSRWRR